MGGEGSGGEGGGGGSEGGGRQSSTVYAEECVQLFLWRKWLTSSHTQGWKAGCGVPSRTM